MIPHLAFSSLPSPARPGIALASAGLTLVLLFAAGGLASAGSVVTGDFNNDGQEDVAVVRNGVYSIRPNAATPDNAAVDLAFATPPRFLLPDTIQVADIDQDRFDDLLLASRSANRLLVIYGQSSLTTPFRFDEFPLPGGPVAAAAAQFVSGDALELVAVLNAHPAPLPNPVAAMLDASGAVLAYYPIIEGSRVGSDSHDVAAAPLLRANPLSQFAWLFDGDDGAELLAWLDFESAAPGLPPTAATTNIIEISGLKSEFDIIEFPAPRLAPGFLLGDLNDGHWVVFPSNADLLAIVPARVPRAAEPVSHIERLGFIASGGALVPESVQVAPSQVKRLILAVAADGSLARLFRWNGPGNLEVVETIDAPPDYRLSSLLSLSNGDFFAMLRPAGTAPDDWTHVGHYDRQSPVKRWNFIQAWPASTKPLPLARVVVFDRDPFASNVALEWESFTVGDWALNASIERGEIIVELQDDAGAPDGLGTPTTTRLQPRRSLPPTAVALANQWEPDTSLFFAGPPHDHSGAAVSPQPAPGSYSAPVSLIFLAESDVEVRFRIGHGEWRTDRGPALLAETATVEFYGVGTDGEACPIQTARYAIGEPHASLPGQLRQDLDGNGLDDAWERLYLGEIGLNPNDDLDGDGFTARHEYEAGTNPLDPDSRPTDDPSAHRRIVAQLDPAGTLTLRLEQVFDATVAVELSTDLDTWLPAPNPLQRNPDGSVEWRELDPPTTIRFFRVRFDPD